MPDAGLQVAADRRESLLPSMLRGTCRPGAPAMTRHARPQSRETLRLVLIVAGYGLAAALTLVGVWAVVVVVIAVVGS